jgi:hypothetical protein
MDEFLAGSSLDADEASTANGGATIRWNASVNLTPFAKAMSHRRVSRPVEDAARRQPQRTPNAENAATPTPSTALCSRGVGSATSAYAVGLTTAVWTVQTAAIAKHSSLKLCPPGLLRASTAPHARHASASGLTRMPRDSARRSGASGARAPASSGPSRMAARKRPAPTGKARRRPKREPTCASWRATSQRPSRVSFILPTARS